MTNRICKCFVNNAKIKVSTHLPSPSPPLQYCGNSKVYLLMRSDFATNTMNNYQICRKKINPYCTNMKYCDVRMHYRESYEDVVLLERHRVVGHKIELS